MIPKTPLATNGSGPGTIQLPASYVSGQFIKADGSSGTPAGGGSPGGNDGNVQVKSGSSFVAGAVPLNVHLVTGALSGLGGAFAVDSAGAINQYKPASTQAYQFAFTGYGPPQNGEHDTAGVGVSLIHNSQSTGRSIWIGSTNAYGDNNGGGLSILLGEFQGGGIYGSVVLNATNFYGDTGAGQKLYFQTSGNETIFGGTIKPGSYTVATLPTAGTFGRVANTTDAGVMYDNGLTWVPLSPAGDPGSLQVAGGSAGVKGFRASTIKVVTALTSDTFDMPLNAGTPSNPTTPAIWTQILIGGVLYYLPGYQ